MMATTARVVFDQDHRPDMVSGRKVDWYGEDGQGRYHGAIFLQASKINTYNKVAVARCAYTGQFFLGQDETCLRSVLAATLNDVVEAAKDRWER